MKTTYAILIAGLLWACTARAEDYTKQTQARLDALEDKTREIEQKAAAAERDAQFDDYMSTLKHDQERVNEAILATFDK